MASPFSVFRRNQRVLMVVLTCTAMFAFVFLDSATKMGSSRAGAAGEVLVKTRTGGVDRSKMAELMQNRQRANEFMAGIFQQAAEAAQASKQMMMSRQPFRFSYGRPSLQQDVLLGYLFRQEAQAMGIVVDKEAINNFLEQVGEQKLTSAGIRDVARSMQISLGEMYRILQDELEAHYFLMFSRPHDSATPGELWTYHQRLNIRQVLEVAAVPVESFTKGIADPSESDLKAYFEKYKKRMPNEYPDFDKPGFKQPDKAQLQYLSLAYEEIEKLVPEVTDQEVVAYYEKNKETQYQTNPFPAESKDKVPGAEQGKKADDKPAPSSLPAPPKPVGTNSGDSKPAAVTPPAKSPTPPPAAKPETKPETKPDGKKQGSLTPRATGRSVAQVQDEQGSPSSAFFAVADDPKPQEKKETPKETSKPTEKAPEAKPAAPAATKPAPESKPAPAAAPASKPTDKPAEGKPASPQTPEKPATKPADSKSEPAKSPPPKYRPLDDGLKDEIREKLLTERTLAKTQELAKAASEKMTEIGIKYNAPILIDQQTLYMDLNGDGKRSAGEPEHTLTGTKPIKQEQVTPEQRQLVMQHVAKMTTDELKKIGGGLKMKSGETGLVSFTELKDLKGVGSCVELDNGASDPFDSNKMTIEQMAFQDQTMFRATRMQDSEKHDLYVVWKVRHVASHVPTFDEEGIKQQVLKRWKMDQALPLAQKRAKELAELAKKNGKPLQESLDKQTLLGGKDEQEIPVQTTPFFSWLRTTQVPSPNPLASESRPELSQVPFVKNPGERFMEVAFNELKIGEVGVATNYDATELYVIQVKERVPSDKDGIDKLQEEFFKSRLFGFRFGGMRLGTTPYDFLAEAEQQQELADWVDNLEKQYAVEWVKEDDTPNQE